MVENNVDGVILKQSEVHTNGMHPLDLLTMMGQHKRLVIWTPVICCTLALIVSLMLTPIFTSVAKIMPPQAQNNNGYAAMLGQLSGLAAVAGAGRSSGDLYVGLLESRTIADRLIARLHLKDRYAMATMDDTRARLAGATAVTNDKKSGFITISTTDKSPQFAADLANAYVDELSQLTQHMSLTEASQRRVFFEKQLKEASEQLAEAEVALRSTQEKTGLIQPDAQVQAIIATTAQTQAMVAAKEVQLNAMRTFATAQNPELLRVQEELRGLRAQLAKQEKNTGTGGGDVMLATGKIPAAGIEYVRSLRSVKYYETMFELLAKQFELAKVDEAKDSTQIQLLDKAIPAERKTKPSRALITLAGLAFGVVLGVAMAFARAAYRSSRGDPSNNARWSRLSAAWMRRT